MKAFIRRVDGKLTLSIQSLPLQLSPYWLFVTNLGHPVMTASIGAGVLFMGRLEMDTDLIVAGASVWVALVIGSLLKQLFRRARPLTQYAAGIWLDKLSFPSGHTTGATVAYGLLAYLSWSSLSGPWNVIGFIICTTLIILVGVSRVYLGAHYPSDVIAGWLLGSTTLIVVFFISLPL